MQTQNESMTLAFPNWIGAKAEVSINRPGDQADVVIELFKGDREIADVLVGINYRGEFVIHTTENAMRTSDEHQATIYPERAVDGDRGDFVDGFGVMLFSSRSLFPPAAAR